MSTHKCKFYFYDSVDEITAAIVENLVKLIMDVISLRGICHVVFPGGRSPYDVFKKLRFENIPWSAVHFYPSDERCVPVGSIDRNDRIIDELLLPYVSLPEENLHRIPAEKGPIEGAKIYCEFLDQLPCFDVALLGVGSDGHIASLFSGHAALDLDFAAIPVSNAPKLPSDRVSIGLSRLLKAKERWIIINGAEKQSVVNQIRLNVDLPVTRIQPTSFFIEKLIDC